MKELEPMRNMVVLDWQHLCSITDGDTEFEMEILGDYLLESAKQLDAMMDASAANDLESVRILSHTLKGSSRTIGACRLGFLGEILETQAKNGSLENSTELFEMVAEGINDLKQAYEERDLPKAA